MDYKYPKAEETVTDYAIRLAQEEKGAVKPQVLAHYDENLKAPEENVYLLLIMYHEDGEEIKDWEYVTGRSAAYNKFREMIEFLDVDNSYIMESSMKVERALTAYEFMKWCILRMLVPEDQQFDIDEYTDNIIPDEKFMED